MSSRLKNSNQERPFHSATTVSIKELPCVSTSKSQKYDVSRVKSELANFNRFIDYNIDKSKPHFGKMKIIKSRLELNPSRTTNATPIKIKEPFQIKKNQLTNAGIDDSKFVFEDRSLYKIYLQLCQKRDAITPVLPDRIEYLKKGIFSFVQYRNYQRKKYFLFLKYFES